MNPTWPNSPFQSKWIRGSNVTEGKNGSDSFRLKWNEFDQIGLVFEEKGLKNQSDLIQFTPFQSKWIRSSNDTDLKPGSDSFRLKWNEFDQIGLIFEEKGLKNQSALIQFTPF